ncbi:hypothetical protein MUDAN_DOGOELCO_01855 [Lactiplantibacillus mudanjiangensis]|uniref:hypothetical protein n=1 Tax=Lactiplantibacillus mudanjiangensis TaxID=1296538 RepID=UPI001013DE13|nr:hypothetical protein [Lactiplantibacillus mudanjiangensis]VDG32599.1 hypothetical protein MUDAN_DOGOELCO_01855 [Lactiplantibacillus mudanjiangensis]
MKKSAIMVIDVQQGSKWLAQHVFKQIAPIDFKTLVARNQALIAHASDAGIPVIMVTMQPRLLPRQGQQ